MNDEHDNAMTDIDMLKRLTKPEPATMKQLNYFTSLVGSRDITAMVKQMPTPWLQLMEQLTADIVDKATSGVYAEEKYAKSDLSQFISQLVKQPMKVEEPQHKQDVFTGLKGNHPFANNNTELEDGMYRHPNGTIYKVYHTVHGSNVQVAKRLMVVESYGYDLQGGCCGEVVGDKCVRCGHTFDRLPATVKFVYEGRKPLYSLTSEMRLTIEQAREFGALYGTCCICGRTLTNELSIHLGIGPVCGRREFGGEFEFMINEAKLELPKHCICPGSPLPYCPVHGSEDYDQGEAN